MKIRLGAGLGWVRMGLGAGGWARMGENGAGGWGLSENWAGDTHMYLHFPSFFELSEISPWSLEELLML